MVQTVVFTMGEGTHCSWLVVHHWIPPYITMSVGQIILNRAIPPPQKKMNSTLIYPIKSIIVAQTIFPGYHSPKYHLVLSRYIPHISHIYHPDLGRSHMCFSMGIVTYPLVN